MTTYTWQILASGTLGGYGLWLVVGCLPRLRAHRLFARLAPHLVDVSPAAREWVENRRPDTVMPLHRIVGPALRTGLALLDAVGLDERALARRIGRAGLFVTVTTFRRRLAMATVCVVSTALLGAGMLAVLGFGAGAVGLIAVAALTVLGAPRLILWRVAERRRARMERELPVVLELMCLAIAAGDGARSAVRRVAERSTGEVGRALARAITASQAGVPFANALREVASVNDVVAFTRFAEQIASAVERGAPVSDVLRAQANDARQLGRRRLLEDASRREVAMMFPLVFLILPLSVLFAIFPGMVAISGAIL